MSLTQRVYSSKTRIKTSPQLYRVKYLQQLKEYIPVKQGLRLIDISTPVMFQISQRVYSSKTRIKTIVYSFPTDTPSGLKEYIPVKQGLRLNTFYVN